MEFWTRLNTELRRWLCKLNNVVPLIVLDVVLVMLMGRVTGVWEKVLEGKVCCFDDCGCDGGYNDGGDCDIAATGWNKGYSNKKVPTNTIVIESNNILIGTNFMDMF